MNVPQLRFKEFSCEWDTQPVGSVCDYIVPGRNKPDSFDGDIPWINIPDIAQNQTIYVSKNKLNITKLEALRIGSKVVPKDAVIISCVGDLGLVAITGTDVVLNQQLHAFIPKHEINVRFLAYELTTKKQYMEKVATRTSLLYMNKENCNSIPISFSTLSEQTKIANFLTTIDERINQLTRKKELMTQYKQGVMQQIFSQQLRFKDDNGEDFGDWEEKNGNFLFAAISNKDHNSDLPILAITQEHGAIPRDLIDYRVSVSDKSVETYKVVEVGDFIISLRSFQGGIEYSNYKGICSPAYLILRSKTQLNSYFYKSYFKTPEYITKLNQHLEGIRDGKMVSYKQFSEILLPLPCLAEQTKIANFLTAIDEKIQHITQQIEATKQYKQGLLQQMFV